MTDARRPTPVILPLAPARARALAVATYTALLAGYAADLAFAPTGTLGVATGVLKLAGLGGCVVLFLTRWSHQAHAPGAEIDERERAERDAAYAAAFRALIGAMFATFVVLVAVQAADAWDPTLGDVMDLLSVLAIGGFALPAVLLAWRDAQREAADAD